MLTSKRRPPVSGRKQDLTAIDTEDQHFHQQALVPLESETHGGEDVVIYADGPGAGLVHGVMEQNALFHILQQATGWPVSTPDRRRGN
jgi:alkaline phosphatase